MNRIPQDGRRAWLKTIGAGAVSLACPVVRGQAAGGRVTTLVVPFSPGGSIDVAVRLVGTEMEKTLGSPVVIDNRVGGSAIIGAEYVARRPPDGATVLVGSNSSLVNNIALFDKLPYDPQKDFVAVGLLGRASLLISARQDAPFRSVVEMVSFAKANPEKVSRGSSGIGNITHIAMLRFEREFGLHLNHVPFSGEAKSMLSLLGGDVDLQIGSVSAATVGYAASGRIRPLALMGPQRHPMMPDVPTMDEAGFRGAHGVSWFAFMVPIGTPADAVGRLNGALNAALLAKGLRERMVQAGIEPLGGMREEADDLIESERKRWVPFLREAGIKAS